MLSDIATLVKKDMIEFRSNKQIWFPVIILPLVISIGLPLTVAFIPSTFSVSGIVPDIPARLLSNLPQELQEVIGTLDKGEQLAFLFISYYFAPTFLVIPLAIPAVLCADSFAGEKERKTIEAILAAPLSDSEILVGKIILPLVSSLASSYIAFSIYSYLVNVLVFHHFVFPTNTWILIMLFLVPALTLFSVGTMIIVSARSKGFKEAQQIGGMIVLPIFVLLITQLLGIISMTSQTLFGTAVVLYAIDAFLIKFGSKAYSRDHLISKV